MDDKREQVTEGSSSHLLGPSQHSSERVIVPHHDKAEHTDIYLSIAPNNSHCNNNISHPSISSDISAYRPIYQNIPLESSVWPRGLAAAFFARDITFTCPDGTKQCPGPGTPYCLNDETCESYVVNGVTAPVCCSAGSNCGGSVATCAGDQISCPTGGGCCGAGAVCVGTGCVVTSSTATSSSFTLRTQESPTTFSSSSAQSYTSATGGQTLASSVTPSLTSSPVTTSLLTSSSSSSVSPASGRESGLSIGGEIGSIIGAIAGVAAVIIAIYQTIRYLRNR